MHESRAHDYPANCAGCLKHKLSAYPCKLVVLKEQAGTFIFCEDIVDIMRFCVVEPHYSRLAAGCRVGFAEIRPAHGSLDCAGAHTYLKLEKIRTIAFRNHLRCFRRGTRNENNGNNQ
jgi:hypothetical protein